MLGARPTACVLKLGGDVNGKIEGPQFVSYFMSIMMKYNSSEFDQNMEQFRRAASHEETGSRIPESGNEAKRGEEAIGAPSEVITSTKNAMRAKICGKVSNKLQEVQ